MKRIFKIYFKCATGIVGGAIAGTAAALTGGAVGYVLILIGAGGLLLGAVAGEAVIIPLSISIPIRLNGKTLHRGHYVL